MENEFVFNNAPITEQRALQSYGLARTFGAVFLDLLDTQRSKRRKGQKRIYVAMVVNIVAATSVPRSS